jgi:ferredoxin-fold anticodon binding domain-containing protein
MAQMTMTGIKSEIPPTVRLSYKKGELIVKEGDFGISIYKIIKGEVRIFNQSEDKEVILAILGPGEIIGEMAFLSKKIQVRSASARAIQDSELEVWHPEILSKDYKDVATVIKHMTDEAQKRLVRMNRFIVQMSVSEEDEKEKPTGEEGKETTSRRTHYRKNVNLTCVYRPVDTPSRLRLNGNIKNISLTGINMEIRAKNAVNFSHDPGDEFSVDLTLPNGKDVHVMARIQATRKQRPPGTFSLGMVFTDMREGAKKTLGFFLMP